MNGSDFIEIIEAHAEEILREYEDSSMFKNLTIEDVPESYQQEWAERYLENGRDEEN